MIKWTLRCRGGVAGVLAIACVILLQCEAHGGSSGLAFIDAVIDNPNGLDRAWRVALSPDGAHLYVTGYRDDGVAVFSRDGGTGALHFVEFASSPSGPEYPKGLALSPGGEHLYVCALRDDTLHVYVRDPFSGALSFVERQIDGHGGVDGLNGATAVAVSPDGAYVYVLGSVDDAVSVFTRDAETGALSFVEMHRDGVSGVNHLDSPGSLALSPGGETLYVAAEIDKAVSVFMRDGETGRLTFLEAQVNDLDGVPTSLCVSADGAQVYVVNASSELATFNREALTGRLSFVEAQEVADSDNGGGHTLALAPGGLHLYVAAFDWADDFKGAEAKALSAGIAKASWHRSFLVTFVRDPDTGALTRDRILANGYREPLGMEKPSGLVVSPDGAQVYVAATYDDTLVSFDRDTVSGQLTHRRNIHDGYGGCYGLDEPQDVVVSPDGAHVYILGDMDQLVTFGRDPATGLLAFQGATAESLPWSEMAGAALALSPDGAWLFAVSPNIQWESGVVVLFSREPQTGGLTLAGSFWDGGADGDLGLFGAVDVAPSADGAHVYVAASHPMTLRPLVEVYAFDSEQGELTHLQSAPAIVGRGHSSLVLSPDGRHVYGASRHALTRFSRDAVSGELGLGEKVYAMPSEEFEGMVVAMSPDGAHLYLSLAAGGAILALARNPEDGALTLLQSLRDGEGGVTGLAGVSDVKVSPDGLKVYATGDSGDSLVVFARNSLTGMLSFVGAETEGVAAVEGLESPRAVAISADGKHVYTVGEASIVAFATAGEHAPPAIHSADQDGDGSFSLSELLRIIQFYQSDGLHCQAGTEDGYAPGTGDRATCLPHAADYHLQDWQITLFELLRIVQLYNANGYHACLDAQPPNEDGYCMN